MKKLSVRYKITAITVVAILTAVLSIFATSYPSIRLETNRISLQMMNLIGNETKQSLDKYFVEIEHSVRLVANLALESLDSVSLVEYGVAGKSTNRQERTAEQIEQMDQYLTAHCDLVRNAIGSIANHTNGVQAYYYVINPEISESVHGFFFSRVGKAGFMTKTPLDAGSFTAKEEWYYAPIREGGPCWVGPFMWNYPEEINIFSYTMPIYSTGELIGVLGMDIPMKTLIDQISPIRIYQTGFASLYGSDGTILYYPEKKKGKAPELLDLSISEELLGQESSGNHMIRNTIQGEERQYTFFTLNNGMKLFLCVPTQEVDAVWIKIVQSIGLTTVVVVFFFTVILMFAMRLLTRPLLRLTSASQRLANADYDVTLDYTGQDEIGTLTNAFSSMRNELKRYIEDLNHLAYFDSLTDLPNMRSFFTLAQEECKRLKQQDKKPVLLFFDLVGMKYYNRQYGFGEGDKLLCQIAQILTRQYGKQCLCRFSEDHFVVITEETSLQAGILQVFAQCEMANGGNSLPVHVGIYEGLEEDTNISTACDSAKYACEKHKGSYLSQYYFFDENLVRELEQVRYIINHLDQALREHWIQVYYQPIISATGGRLCDEEALSRWLDPERGMISPASFITILEKARLIYQVDLFVVDEVLKKIHREMELGMDVVPHSINLSRSDFDVCDMVEEIRRRVDEAGLPRSILTIEVTESILGSGYDYLKEQIQRFQKLGFQVWMDDFGSGYSSLDILHELHFDLIKFDMRFLQNFEKGEENKIILNNLIRMARELGIDTLCEGVETLEAAEFLRDSGCHKLQGYYFSRPVPFETIVQRFKENKRVGYEFHEG